MELSYIYTAKNRQVRLLGSTKLTKLKRKNIGNQPLVQAIDQLTEDIKNGDWTTREELKADRDDADLVHSDGFYFFDINVHRTMALVEFNLRVEEEGIVVEDNEEEDDGSVQVLWVGSHEDYERIFKNDKNVIKRWLNQRSFI